MFWYLKWICLSLVFLLAHFLYLGQNHENIVYSRVQYKQLSNQRMCVLWVHFTLNTKDCAPKERSNGTNVLVFSFLSSLPLLPPATTAAIGSMSSLYSKLALYRPWEDKRGPLEWRDYFLTFKVLFKSTSVNIHANCGEGTRLLKNRTMFSNIVVCSDYLSQADLIKNDRITQFTIIFLFLLSLLGEKRSPWWRA